VGRNEEADDKDIDVGISFDPDQGRTPTSHAATIPATSAAAIHAADRCRFGRETTSAALARLLILGI
jgi:hypothetical protein